MTEGELEYKYGSYNYWRVYVEEGNRFRLVGNGTNDVGFTDICYFTLGDLPEDFKNWLMIGLTAPENVCVYPLPNWENYEGTNETTIDVTKYDDALISIYAPTKLIAQIKGI